MFFPPTPLSKTTSPCPSLPSPMVTRAWFWCTKRLGWTWSPHGLQGPSQTSPQPWAQPGPLEWAERCHLKAFSCAQWPCRARRRWNIPREIYSRGPWFTRELGSAERGLVFFIFRLSHTRGLVGGFHFKVRKHSSPRPLV